MTTARPAPHRRRDRVLLVLALALAVVLVARAARKQAGVLVNNQEFGARFLDRDDPYVERATGLPEHGPYPPSYALVCAPLALLSERAARVAWALAQVGCLAWLFVLLRERLRRTWPRAAPHAAPVYAAALLLVSRYLLRDTAAGGGNLIYATLAWTGLELSARRRPGRAGLAVALGLVAKPNLAVLLGFYAARRRWRTLAASLAATLALAALPAAYYGPGAYAELCARWGRDVLRYAALEDLRDASALPPAMPRSENAMNQSLREAVARLARPATEERVPSVNVVELGPRVTAWASRLLGLALCAAALIVAFRAPPGRAAWHAAGAFFVLALLLSPITWKAHCVALLPVFALLVAEWHEVGRPHGLAAFLVAYYLVCDLASEELLGKDAKLWLQALSVVTWANLVLLLVLLRQAVRVGGLAADAATQKESA